MELSEILRMNSKEDLVKSLIIKQSQESTEDQTSVESLQHFEPATIKQGDETEAAKNDTGQEYVYWARRGENELETAGEVEVSSSGVEQENGKILLILKLCVPLLNHHEK